MKAFFTFKTEQRAYYPKAFMCLFNLLLTLAALFLCQRFFFASLSIMLVTLGKNFLASS